jgi:hypothetical protein
VPLRILHTHCSPVVYNKEVTPAETKKKSTESVTGKRRTQKEMPVSDVKRERETEIHVATVVGEPTQSPRQRRDP